MKKKRLTALIAMLAAVTAASFLAPGMIEAGADHEYKFVRLVDDGAMPVISEALNREAERGWTLTHMAAVAGDPGTILLVFER